MDIPNTIYMLIPVLSYIGLMYSIRVGKLANIYMFAVVTLATLILGAVSLSMMDPVDASASTMAGWVSNVMVAVYIGAMLYGGYGARTGSVERLLIGGVFVALVSMVSAVI